MAWTQIDPVPYTQQVYKLNKLNKIKELSLKRVNGNDVFQQANARAQLIKKQQDETLVSLNIEAYRKKMAQWKAEEDEFEKLFEPEVLNNVQNLSVDMAGIEADESKKARNDEWLKEIKKDLYLLETLNIMHDMISKR